jgi:hypothetical protein
MSKRFAIRCLVVFAALLAAPWCAQADTFTFATLPANGAVSGPAGTTVGWGYTITNQSATSWLVTTGINADPFQNGTPLALFDFPIVAPLTTVVLAFDPVNGLGLYQLTWDPNAPVGFNNSGMFVLSGEWWTGDPFAGGQFLQFALDQSAGYSATVSPAATVPEPASMFLLLSGLGGVALRRLRRRRRD